MMHHRALFWDLCMFVLIMQMPNVKFGDFFKTKQNKNKNKNKTKKQKQTNKQTNKQTQTKTKNRVNFQNTLGRNK